MTTHVRSSIHNVISDEEAPVFNMNTCPANLVVDIDSPDNTALVKWTIPEGTDNSGQQPIITEINGYTPNSRFTAGTHLLNYKIEDSEGNIGQSCVFTLRVQSKCYVLFVSMYPCLTYIGQHMRLWHLSHRRIRWTC